jgi:hypothetical protein
MQESTRLNVLSRIFLNTIHVSKQQKEQKTNTIFLSVHKGSWPKEVNVKVKTSAD